KSEIEFTVDNVAPLFSGIGQGKASILPTNNACRRIRVDFVLFVNDQEVGCGEIKSPGTTSQLLEEDWARTAETLKRQLPVCIMKSKDTKEFKVLE
ncbi:hypothetical protein BCV71DRAFT_276070, partial [Rhizopus microsporus]